MEQKKKPPKTKPSLIRNCINHSPFRCGFFLITLTWFALSPTGRAVTPPPDGGYPNGNTAEGTNALFKLTTGNTNTTIGFNTLFNLTTGGGNTANNYIALFNYTTGFGNTAN